MVRLSIVALFASLILVPAASAQEAPPPNGTRPPPEADPTRPAAIVNGTPITRAELDGAFKQAKVSDHADRMPTAEIDKIKLRILHLLVNRVLLNQHMNELKINVDEKLVADHVKQIRERLASQGQNLEVFLHKLGVTEEQMRGDIRNDYRWLAYVESQGKESVLRKYYQENLEAFDGSQARARHILIKAPEGSSDAQKELARRRAADLRERITKGEAFDALAQQYSDCPSREKGGELPQFPRKGVMAEPFAKAAFALKEGELSQVVETEFGCHLIVSIEKKPGPKPTTFEESADDVKSYYAEDLRKAVVARLRSKAKIKILFP